MALLYITLDNWHQTAQSIQFFDVLDHLRNDASWSFEVRLGNIVTIDLLDLLTAIIDTAHSPVCDWTQCEQF